MTVRPSFTLPCLLLCFLTWETGFVGDASADPSSAGAHPVSLHVQDVDIRNVLRLLGEERNLDVVIADEVTGPISIKLKDVPWKQALAIVLKSKGLGYQERDQMIFIDRLENLEKELVTKVFYLKHVDANDLKTFLQPILSPLGSISGFTEKGRTRFAFGTEVTEQKQALTAERQRSQIISIRDNQAVVDQAAEIIEKLDTQPKQIAIDVKIVEVTLSRDHELGVNWNMEVSTAGSSFPTTFPFPGPGTGPFTPAGGEAFPAVGSSDFTFGIVDARNMRATLKALEARGKVNVLSSPHITTLNNLEASILVGEHFPITQETIEPLTSIRTVTLDHYEKIGIQLIVIPQISGERDINMILHPAVSTIGELVGERFPRINTREADTQVMVRDGQTVVIGGLLQDRDSVEIRKVPFLGDIPLIKRFFRNVRENTRKVELLIFATPQILEGPGDDVRGTALGRTLPSRIDREAMEKLMPDG